MIHLIAEVLDTQVVDARGENAGRVDGIIAEVGGGGPPRIVAIEISPITLFARFSPRLARWYARWDSRLGAERGAPYRVPWESLDRTRGNIKLDREVADTPINAFENWLRTKFVGRIPGSG